MWSPIFWTLAVLGGLALIGLLGMAFQPEEEEEDEDYPNSD